MDLPTIIYIYIYFTVFHAIGDLNSIRNKSIKTDSFVQNSFFSLDYLFPP